MKSFNENIFRNKEQLRDLLKQVDLFNTVNGGTVMTSVDIIGSEESVVIKVATPSVGVDAFHILLNYTRLTISVWIREENEGYEGRPVLVPMFAKNFDVPALVDLDGIVAEHENGELTVTLPFKNTIESLQRMIEIKNK
jgi:HSP20 family protein